jgi:molecular chaperone GrpE
MSDPTDPEDPDPRDAGQPVADAIDETAPGMSEVPGLVDVELVGPAEAYESIDTVVGPVPGEFGLREDPQAIPPGAPGAANDPLEPILDAIGRLGEVLGGKLDRLQGVVDRELRAESSREKVVDRLHAELQEYKNDLILKIARPIFIDLIQLHDDMGKMADSLGDDRASCLLRDFQQGIEDILYRQEVEPFRNEGEGFDPRRQRAVSTVSTDDPGRDKTIAARLRPGFALGDKVIRPELVSVHALRRLPGDGRGPDVIDG